MNVTNADNPASSKFKAGKVIAALLPRERN